jgi:hypothetical protein
MQAQRHLGFLPSQTTRTARARTPRAPPGRGRSGIPIHPLDDATFELLSLSVGMRHAALIREQVVIVAD